MKIQHLTGARKIRGASGAASFSAVAIPITTTTNPGSTTQQTVQDRVVDVTTCDTVDTTARIEASSFVGRRVVLANTTPAVATLNADGTLTWVANGTCRVVASIQGAGSALVSAPVSRATAASTESLVNLAAGSLARHIRDATLALVAGKTANDASRLLFSAYDQAAGTYTRSVTHILAGLGLTGISCAYATPGTVDAEPNGRKVGVLVSPRHFITANHYPPNESLTFAGSDGLAVTRAISGYQVISGTDIAVGVLASDVPATITPHKVLPANYLTKLPSELKYAHSLPLVSLNYAYTQPFKIDIMGSLLATDIYVGRATQAEFSDWTRATNASSSHPAFWPINGELVLAGAQWTTSSTSHIAAKYSQINAAMTTLGGGHQLTAVDLSAFTSY